MGNPKFIKKTYVIFFIIFDISRKKNLLDDLWEEWKYLVEN